MAIKAYGSNTYPGTVCFVSTPTTHGVMLQFINVTGSIDYLKELITLRNTSPLYDDMRGSGTIRFPFIQSEGGTYTRDMNAALARLGIDEKMEFSK